jgi:hypothetical protein
MEGISDTTLLMFIDIILRSISFQTRQRQELE